MPPAVVGPSENTVRQALEDGSIGDTREQIARVAQRLAESAQVRAAAGSLPAFGQAEGPALRIIERFVPRRDERRHRRPDALLQRVLARPERLAQPLPVE